VNPIKGLYWKRKRLRLGLGALLSPDRRRSITRRDGLRKLNLGAGDRPLAGWVNCDLEAGPGIDIVGTASDLGAIADASFDVVRASHLLEHFYLNETTALLGEWMRVLRPGGTLMVCVPDFRGVVRDYLDNPSILQPGGFELPYRQEKLPGKYVYLAHIFGWYYEDGSRPPMQHRMVFDFESLARLLTRDGTLTAVREFDYRKEEPYLLGVEDASTNLWSLNVAAIKRGTKQLGTVHSGRTG
jgi:predicted SAM-dependent methyltransferase